MDPKLPVLHVNQEEKRIRTPKERLIALSRIFGGAVRAVGIARYEADISVGGNPLHFLRELFLLLARQKVLPVLQVDGVAGVRIRIELFRRKGRDEKKLGREKEGEKGGRKRPSS